MSGFVYVMSNPAFPHLVKIGKSSKDPTVNRVKELNHTGVPAAFKVEYYAYVSDEDSLETKVHASLSAQRFNENREFFTASVSTAVGVIRELARKFGWLKYEEVFFTAPETPNGASVVYTQNIVKWKSEKDRNSPCSCKSGRRWKHCCGMLR
jgi:hypothetical protein